MSAFSKRTFSKTDTIFVLVVITLFAATSLSLALIGTKQYHHITNTMSENYNLRTVSSYLTEKIHQYDSKDAITIVDLDGTPALSLFATEGDISYATYIYCYNGALRELVVTKDSVYSLSGGQEIIKLQDFQPTLINSSLIHAIVTDIDGNQQHLYFSLRCIHEKEEL
ncbi:MAG: DUF4860 domain-containing protein [Lachnospiraceae bacterium]|nr:DUF4860 domain-containing protein [Lachnospiraceae bacterium]